MRGTSQKTPWVAALLAGLAACQPAPAPAPAPPPVAVVAPDPVDFETEPVASIDGVDLPVQAFNTRYRVRMDVLQGPPVGHADHTALILKREITRQLIDEALVARAAQAAGLTADPSQVEAGMAEVRARYPDEATYREALLQRHGGHDALQAAVTERVLLDALAGPAPDVTDDEVAAAYAENPDRWHRPVHAYAEEIALLRADPDDPRGRLAALRLRVVDDGVSFRHLARLYSEAPTAAEGGDLGVVTADRVDPAIWTALTALDEGEVSPVIETADRFVLVHLQHHRPAVSMSLAQAAPVLRTELTERRVTARREAVLADLRAVADVEDRLESRYADALQGAAPMVSDASAMRDRPPADLPSGGGRGALPPGRP